MPEEPTAAIRPKFSAVAAPVERPLPLWILYPLLFVAVYLSHWSLLRLPYFWDEAGYYIPAALDFFRTGSLVPHSTLTNAHPPLPSILLAGWWHIAGTAINGTRTFVCMVSAAALLGGFRLTRLLAGSMVAAIVTLLTAFYPVWFAQSTLAHADIFAATFTLWALSFYFERFLRPASWKQRTLVAVLFSLAALSKETAIITPLALGLWEVVGYVLPADRTLRSARISATWLSALLAPALPLALWYLYHFHKTGFIFGNPEFLRYNATANMSVSRVLVSLWHRIIHLTLHMNMFVPVVATVAALLMPLAGWGRHATRAHKPVLMALAVVLAGNAIAFSILGGALLTRYLLPMYPLVLLICVAIWQSRTDRTGRLLIGLTALTAAAFLSALWVNPPYAFAPEDNLTYRDMVVLHQQAVSLIAKQYPYATVLSAWPATAEMQYPDLGYTRAAIKVVPIDNFSEEQVRKAADEPGAYDTALVFSTKWAPAAGAVNLARASELTDARYFDFHHDLSPAEVAALLRGQVVWQGRRHGEWAAVLRFPRSVEARLQPPATRPNPL